MWHCCRGSLDHSTQAAWGIDNERKPREWLLGLPIRVAAELGQDKTTTTDGWAGRSRFSLIRVLECRVLESWRLGITNPKESENEGPGESEGHRSE